MAWPHATLFVVYCAGPHCNGADKAALKLAAPRPAGEGDAGRHHRLGRRGLRLRDDPGGGGLSRPGHGLSAPLGAGNRELRQVRALSVSCAPAVPRSNGDVSVTQDQDARKRHKARRSPRHADRPLRGGRARHLQAAERPARRCLRALPQDQELPLARQRAAFPRLPSAPRRAGRADLRHHRRAGRARAQDRRHHAALDRRHRQAPEPSRTTTSRSWRPTTCCAS